jgi:hypothetical protein
VTHALDPGRHVEEIARCHGFAQKALGEGAPRAAQRAYIAEVAAQLGAALPESSPDQPTPRRPRFRPPRDQVRAPRRPAPKQKRRSGRRAGFKRGKK